MAPSHKITQKCCYLSPKKHKSFDRLRINFKMCKFRGKYAIGKIWSSQSSSFEITRFSNFFKTLNFMTSICFQRHFTSQDISPFGRMPSLSLLGTSYHKVNMDLKCGIWLNTKRVPLAKIKKMNHIISHEFCQAFIKLMIKTPTLH